MMSVLPFYSQLFFKSFCLILALGPHFAAVNQNNEIIVTDFHNHTVKVCDFEI